MEDTMKKLLMIGIMLMASVSAFAAKPTPKLDANCEHLADVGEGLSRLKAIGYTVGELNSFTTESTVQKFPIQSLKKYVYAMEPNGTSVRDQLSALCNTVTFNTFNRYLLQDEELEKVKAENVTLQVTVTSLQEDNRKLQERLNPPSRVKVSNTPSNKH
jgi:hypothetical protein